MEYKKDECRTRWKEEEEEAKEEKKSVVTFMGPGFHLV
jgi:hypothetical protein